MEGDGARRVGPRGRREGSCARQVLLTFDCGRSCSWVATHTQHTKEQHATQMCVPRAPMERGSEQRPPSEAKEHPLEIPNPNGHRAGAIGRRWRTTMRPRTPSGPNPHGACLTCIPNHPWCASGGERGEQGRAGERNREFVRAVAKSKPPFRPCAGLSAALPRTVSPHNTGTTHNAHLHCSRRFATMRVAMSNEKAGGLPPCGRSCRPRDAGVWSANPRLYEHFPTVSARSSGSFDAHDEILILSSELEWWIHGSWHAFGTMACAPPHRAGVRLGLKRHL